MIEKLENADQVSSVLISIHKQESSNDDEPLENVKLGQQLRKQDISQPERESTRISTPLNAPSACFSRYGISFIPRQT